MVTVEEVAASSVTTVTPLANVVTDTEEALAWEGVVLGKLNNFPKICPKERTKKRSETKDKAPTKCPAKAILIGAADKLKNHP